MSSTPTNSTHINGVDTLTKKQCQILSYLSNVVDDTTYIKSSEIACNIGLSSKEVGTNIPAIMDANTDLTIEKWAYSNGTTWKITQNNQHTDFSTTHD